MPKPLEPVGGGGKVLIVTMSDTTLHQRPCAVDGCTANTRGRRLCNKHQKRRGAGKPLITWRESFAKERPPSDGVVFIPLTRQLVAMVDEKDGGHLSRWIWRASNSKQPYACRTVREPNGTKHEQKMHREIMGNPAGLDIDHINHNTLDNRRCNLRVASRSQNAANCKGRGNKYKGVWWDEEKQRWRARITVNYQGYNLGRFDNEEDAAIAYNVAAQLFFGEFALLNRV